MVMTMRLSCFGKIFSHKSESPLTVLVTLRLPCYTMLLDSDYCIVMYLLCCLNETKNICCVTQVSQTATDVTCHILDGQLLMTEDLWKEVLNALMRSLPVLEVGSLSQINLEHYDLKAHISIFSNF